MDIFASTTPSAKSSLPLAIAPTKMAIECVSGSEGKYFDSLTIGASPDNAIGPATSMLANRGLARGMRSVLSLIVLAGK